MDGGNGAVGVGLGLLLGWLTAGWYRAWRRRQAAQGRWCRLP